MRILFLTLLLCGCATLDTCVPVTKEVYKYPEFSTPIRPLMQIPDSDTVDGVVIRQMESNMLDLMKYAEQLEVTLKSIKKAE